MSDLYEGFFKAVENRRTYYALKAESPISDEKIVEIVKRAVKYSPNSFNMQQSRAIVLLGKAHTAHWARVRQCIEQAIPDKDMADQQTGRVDGAFAPAYATVLFFEDQAIVKEWGKNMPPLADVFAIWSDNAAGILHFNTWTALEAEGFGCSLQHHAGIFPNIQSMIVKELNLPESWSCSAMMPFGVPAGPPGNPAHPKTFESLEERVKVVSA